MSKGPLFPRPTMPGQPFFRNTKVQTEQTPDPDRSAPGVLRAFPAIAVLATAALPALGLIAYLTAQSAREAQLQGIGAVAQAYVKAAGDPAADAPLAPILAVTMRGADGRRRDGLNETLSRDDIDGLRIALGGDVAVNLSDDDRTRGQIEADSYVPILDPATGAVSAIAEIRSDATAPTIARWQAARNIWLIAGLVAAALVLTLGLAAAACRQLVATRDRNRNLDAQNLLAAERAERLQRDMTRGREQLLDRIGAELRRGPVELVQQLMAEPDSLAERRRLLDRLMRELTSIGGSLALPEVAGAPLDEVLRRAALRHHDLTGAEVEMKIGALPPALDDEMRLCLYRVVQQGLTTAQRQGNPDLQRIVASSRDDMLMVSVQSAGPQGKTLSERPRLIRFDLQAMQNGLEQFGGSLDLRRLQGGGSELLVNLPVGRRDARPAPRAATHAEG